MKIHDITLVILKHVYVAAPFKEMVHFIHKKFHVKKFHVKLILFLQSYCFESITLIMLCKRKLVSCN